MVTVQRSGPEQGSFDTFGLAGGKVCARWVCKCHHIVLCVLMNVHVFFVRLLLRCGRALPLA